MGRHSGSRFTGRTRAGITVGAVAALVAGTLTAVVGTGSAQATPPVGLTGYTIVTGAPATIPANGAGQSIPEYANCKPTQVAIGAGVISQSPFAILRSLSPTSDVSWLAVVTMTANLPTATSFTPYLVCVDATSVPGYHVASNLGVTVHSPGGASASASCATGEVALGGGAVDHNPASYVSTTAPTAGDTGWSATVYNTATPGFNENFSVYAVCVPQSDVSTISVDTATAATPGTSLTNPVSGSSALTGTANAPTCPVGTVATGGGTTNSNAINGYVSSTAPTPDGRGWSESSTLVVPDANTETSLPDVVCATGTATVTITGANAVMTYGGTAPNLTFTTAGLVNGDTLGTGATCTSTGLTAGAGTYPITCSGADAGPHYSIAYVAGTLTVRKASLQITPVSQSIVYGSPDPTFTANVTGLVGSDHLITPPTCGVAAAHTNVGNYSITCSTADAGPNYTITYNTGSLHVTPAPVVITPDSQSIVYGESDPTFTSTTSGLLNGDQLLTLATCQVNGAHSNAGTYPITCSSANAGPNYTISYGPGTLTVAKRAGVVTPDPQEITYGQADPTFTFTVSGVLPGDSLPELPTCGVSGAHSDAGTYTITCSGGKGGTNYTLDETATSTLIVDRAAVTVVPSNQTINYGQADPAFTSTTTGLVPGDHLLTEPTCGVSGAHSNAGTYTITCSGADGGNNYTVDESATATLTVNQLVAVVTPSAQEITYGQADPTFTFTVSGVLPGDSLSALPTCGVAGAHTNIGTYMITCSGGNGGTNYTLDESATATLTVDAAALTVSANNQTISYGQPDPAFTFSTVGLVPGDHLPVTPTCGVAGAHTAPGMYSIVCTGPSSGGNYTISYVAGTLTVTKAATTLTAVAVPPTVNVLGLLKITLPVFSFSATLARTDNHAVIAGEIVTFTYGGSTICTAVTNSKGVASCTFIGVIVILGASPSYTATFAGDADYVASSGAAKI